MGERWMIISWKHIDYVDAAYGELLTVYEGTEEHAKQLARGFAAEGNSPVGIVQEITARTDQQRGDE
mgnify:CR=1 FL=1